MLSRLHWLKALDQISYKVAVLVYTSVNTVWRRRLTYVSDELRRPADTEARQRLRSASSMSLPRIQLSMPSATERFLLRPLVCGTVFHLMSPLLHLSLSPQIPSLISFLSQFLTLFHHVFSARCSRSDLLFCTL